MHSILNALPDPDVQVDSGKVYSNRFNDIYFAGDGPKETQRVFLEPARIVNRILQQSEFTIFEFGFGTGLNFLALMQHLQHRSHSCRIRYIAIEQFPLSSSQINSALQPFAGELDCLTELLNSLPPRVPGWHRRFFENHQVELTLGYGSIKDGLVDFHRTDRAGVDAWFLDGFAPARNPDMWEPHLFDLMFGRTKNQGTVTSFSAAGEVRRNLAAAGFKVTRVEGQEGHKRHSTLAMASAATLTPRILPKQVTVVGAGLAGTTVAGALAQRGVGVQLFDKQGSIAQLSSSNPRAIQHPRLSAAPTINSLYRIHSYAHSQSVAERLTAVDQRGALQIDDDNMSQKRNHLVADFFDDDWCLPIDSQESRERTNGLIQTPAVFYPRSSVIDCQQLCHQLIDNPLIEFINGELDTQHQNSSGTQVIATGNEVSSLLYGIPLEVYSQGGQVDQFSFLSGNLPITEIILNNGYLVSHENTITSGSTYEWDGWTQKHSTDLNRQRVLSSYPDAKLVWNSCFRSTRLVAKDRFPVIGQLVPHVWLSLAHGSSGTCSTPFAAEQIACSILQEIGIGAPDFDTLLNPHRFATRQQRRGIKHA